MARNRRRPRRYEPGRKGQRFNKSFVRDSRNFGSQENEKMANLTPKSRSSDYFTVFLNSSSSPASQRPAQKRAGTPMKKTGTFDVGYKPWQTPKRNESLEIEVLREESQRNIRRVSLRESFDFFEADEPKEQFSPNSNSCCKDDVVSSRQELQMKNQGPRKQNLPRLRDVNKDEHEPKEVAFHFSSPFPRKGNIPAFPMDLSSIKKKPPPPASKIKRPVPMESPTFKAKPVESKIFQDIMRRSSRKADKVNFTKKEKAVITVDVEDKNNEPQDNLDLIPGVTLHDYATLEMDEFVNDSIISFYLDWMTKHKLKDQDRDDVHVFSSHFYGKLTSGPKKSNANAYSMMNHETRAYERVKNWTKKLDLFSKRMVIFPICEDYHWYVIIACNPGNIDKSRNDQVVRGSPYFLILDSLDKDHSNAVKSLRSFFGQEYKNKRGKAIMFSQEKMPEKNPAIPTQQNSCDCGLYLLHYIELIFQNPSRFYFSTKMGELSHWFPQHEIHGKREDIAQLIQKLARDNNRARQITFPDLKFVRRSKRHRKLEIKQPPDKTEMENEATNGDQEMSPEDFAKKLIANSPLFTCDKIDQQSTNAKKMNVVPSNTDEADDGLFSSVLGRKRKQKRELDLIESKTGSSNSSEDSAFFSFKNKKVFKNSQSSTTSFDQTNPLLNCNDSSEKQCNPNPSSKEEELKGNSKRRRFKLVRTNF